MVYLPNIQNISIAINELNNGNIISIPTDTLYALTCDSYNDEAVAKIYELKTRDSNKPLPILVGSIEQGASIAVFDKVATTLATKFWPGALTLVLAKKNNINLSTLISKNNDFIAIRMPNHSLTLEIIHKLGKPIIGTSANLSGEASLNDPQEIERQFKDKVTMVIGNQSDISPASSLPSTIIKCINNQIEILREGAICTNTIMAALS